MATRTSFRPRPLDLNKQIEIIRDISQLDSTSTDAAGQQQATTLESIVAAAEVCVPVWMGHGRQAVSMKCSCCKRLGPRLERA